MQITEESKQPIPLISKTICEIYFTKASVTRKSVQIAFNEYQMSTYLK